MSSFHKALKLFEKFYGLPLPLRISDPFELILWENVAYLVNDEKREIAFSALKEKIGLRPTDILSASTEELLAVTALGGIFPELRAARLRDAAQMTVSDFDGDLNKILALPLPKAKKALKGFPDVGDMGADRILLFTKTDAIPALESNGLRVLIRLGLAEEKKSYSSTYRCAQEAILDQAKPDFDLFIKAYQLLRRHGQELCKRNKPLCEKCPVRKKCRYFLEING